MGKQHGKLKTALIFYSADIKLYVIFKLEYWAERFSSCNDLLLSGDLICILKMQI